jgi:hypothetical protein
MTPDRYEISPAGRRRVQGTAQKRGAKMGLPTWGSFAFGSVFVAVGTGVMFMGMKVIKVAGLSY